VVAVPPVAPPVALLLPWDVDPLAPPLEEDCPPVVDLPAVAELPPLSVLLKELPALAELPPAGVLPAFEEEAVPDVPALVPVEPPCAVRPADPDPPSPVGPLPLDEQASVPRTKAKGTNLWTKEFLLTKGLRDSVVILAKVVAGSSSPDCQFARLIVKSCEGPSTRRSPSSTVSAQNIILVQKIGETPTTGWQAASSAQSFAS
jgi:hypothetical protein